MAGSVDERTPLLAFDIKHNIELHEGISAVCASSVKDAWLQLENQFDLVFLDINVRDGTTYDLARELRKRMIPFVFTSGSFLPSLPEDLRAEQYIPKPCDYKRISTILQRVALKEHLR